MALRRLTEASTQILLAATLLVATTDTFAQADPSRGNDEWTFQLAPYLWGAGQTGSVRVGRLPDTPVNADFSDILKNLKLGAMGAFEAHNGRWSILADGFYVKVGTTSDPLLGGRLGTARLGGDTTLLQLAAGYRICNESSYIVDVVAGARYTNLLSKLDLSQSPLLPAGARFSSRYDWTDGFGGIRAIYRLGPAWTLTGYVDLGAGGTDLSWQALLGLKYRMSTSTDLAFGYRILSQDYSDSGFHYNVRTGGPYLGVSFNF